MVGWLVPLVVLCFRGLVWWFDCLFVGWLVDWLVGLAWSRPLLVGIAGMLVLLASLWLLLAFYSWYYLVLEFVVSGCYFSDIPIFLQNCLICSSGFCYVC